MDPISALNVAAATIQFVDFSIQVLALCKEVYQSPNGMTEAYADLEKEAKSVKDAQQDLRAALTANTTANEKVKDLAGECIKTSIELDQLLSGVKSGQKAGKLDAFKTVYRSFRQKTKIEKLEKKLKDQRNALNFRINSEVLIHVDQAAVKNHSYFTQLRNQQLDIQKQHTDRHQQLTESLARLETGNEKSEASILRKLDHMHVDISLGLDSSQSLQDLKEALLNSLFYPEMDSRKESIKEAHSDTFDWVFDQPQNAQHFDDFGNWLEDSDATLYWINGKAGSGKSTLMSRILTSNSTRERLCIWSGDSSLQICQFFFWNPGTSNQRSAEGLLQSILYQIVEGVNGAAEAIFSSCKIPLARIPAWTESRLLLALQAVFELCQYCFCLFIDGLDECDGDFTGLVNIIHKLGQSAKVKICVSSRPLPEFTTILSSSANLSLEELNYHDISHYVQTRLSIYDTEDHDTSSLQWYLNPHRQIRSEIIGDAAGVFLWAVLVTEAAVRGYELGDEPEIIIEEIRASPAELTALYDHMFKDIKHSHREYLNTLYNLMHLNAEFDFDGLSLPEVSSVLMEPRVCPQSYEDLLSRCNKTAEIINFRSRGLLTFTKPSLESEDDLTSNKEATTPRALTILDEPAIDEIHSIQFASLGKHQTWKWTEQTSEAISNFHMSFEKKLNWIHRSAYEHFQSTDVGMHLTKQDKAQTLPLVRKILEAVIRNFVVCPIDINETIRFSSIGGRLVLLHAILGQEEFHLSFDVVLRHSQLYDRFSAYLVPNSCPIDIIQFPFWTSIVTWNHLRPYVANLLKIHFAELRTFPEREPLSLQILDEVPDLALIGVIPERRLSFHTATSELIKISLETLMSGYVESRSLAKAQRWTELKTCIYFSYNNAISWTERESMQYPGPKRMLQLVKNYLGYCGEIEHSEQHKLVDSFDFDLVDTYTPAIDAFRRVFEYWGIYTNLPFEQAEKEWMFWRRRPLIILLRIVDIRLTRDTRVDAPHLRLARMTMNLVESQTPDKSEIEEVQRYKAVRSNLREPFFHDVAEASISKILQDATLILPPLVRIGPKKAEHPSQLHVEGSKEAFDHCKKLLLADIAANKNGRMTPNAQREMSQGIQDHLEEVFWIDGKFKYRDLWAQSIE